MGPVPADALPPGPASLRAVETVLACPVCAAQVAVTDDNRALCCVAGHRFDLARQGYVSLLDGRSTSHRSDTAAMVAARRRVHDSGLFDAVGNAVADAVDDELGRHPAMVLDAGAGTGHYLAAVLDRDVTRHGVGIDLSKYCARAVARCHPRAASLVADVWRPLPLRTESVDAVLSIFSPRNIAEFARVLRPGGVLVVVIPDPAHLGEIVGPMRMLSVGAGKDERLAGSLAGVFDVVADRAVRQVRALDAGAVADLVAMGPSAFHRTPEEIAADADALTAGATVDVTVSVMLSTCRVR